MPDSSRRAASNQDVTRCRSRGRHSGQGKVHRRVSRKPAFIANEIHTEGYDAGLDGLAEKACDAEAGTPGDVVRIEIDMYREKAE